MSIMSFLSGLGSYYQNVQPGEAQYGTSGVENNAYAPNQGFFSLAQGTEQDLGHYDPSSEVRAPFYFAQLLKDASKPGGALSPLYMDRAFAQNVGSIINQERGRSYEQGLGLAQSGVNPAVQAGISGQDPLRAQMQIGQARYGAEKQLAEDQFNANQMMANVMWQSDSQMAQLMNSAYNRDIQADQSNKSMLSGLMSSGLMAAGFALGGPLGGLLAGKTTQAVQPQYPNPSGFGTSQNPWWG